MDRCMCRSTRTRTGTNEILLDDMIFPSKEGNLLRKFFVRDINILLLYPICYRIAKVFLRDRKNKAESVMKRSNTISCFLERFFKLAGSYFTKIIADNPSICNLRDQRTLNRGAALWSSRSRSLPDLIPKALASSRQRTAIRAHVTLWEMFEIEGRLLLQISDNGIRFFILIRPQRSKPNSGPSQYYASPNLQEALGIRRHSCLNANGNKQWYRKTMQGLQSRLAYVWRSCRLRSRLLLEIQLRFEDIKCCCFIKQYKYNGAFLCIQHKQCTD